MTWLLLRELVETAVLSLVIFLLIGRWSRITALKATRWTESYEGSSSSINWPINSAHRKEAM